MSTRLERLFLLLESGSVSTRKAAALQLGDIPRQTHEFRTIFGKLLTLLRSSAWDTRIAAGQALGAIAENIPPWNAAASDENPTAGHSSLTIEDKFRLSDLDVDNVVAQGTPLVGSEGKEYEAPLDAGETNLQSRRSAFNDHLGLGDFADKAGLGSLASEMVADVDLLPSVSCPDSQPNGISARDMLLTQSDISMSARQRNRHKRKLRTSFSRSASCDDSNDMEMERPDTLLKRVKSATDSTSASDEFDTEDQKDDQWSCSRLLEILNEDLFHPNWHVRHGAATGIRDVMRVHGRSVGKASWMSSAQAEYANQRCLEDCVSRLICVLALDRFGDFVSYEVVAPVRETCAQAVGAAVKWLSAELTDEILDLLLSLVRQNNWQARHGGLLGIKYVLLVKKGVIRVSLSKAESVLVDKLRDEIDDVCAVAANVLEAVMDDFVVTFPEKIPVVLSSLWNGLLDFDDLTSWTTSFMTLLSTIVAKCDHADVLKSYTSLDQLLPRLWPFLDHPSSKIRSCVLRTVETLVRTAGTDTRPTHNWLSVILPSLLRRTFKRAVLEQDSNVHLDIVSLWKTSIEHGDPLKLQETFDCMIGAWLVLGMHVATLPLDGSLFGLEETLSVTPNGEKHVFVAGGEISGEDAVIRDVHVIRNRLLCASLLAAGTQRFLEPDVQPFNILSLLSLHLQSKSALQKLFCALIIHSLFNRSEKRAVLPLSLPIFAELTSHLAKSLEENIVYDELAPYVTTMHLRCRGLLDDLSTAGVPVNGMFLRPILSVDECHQLVEQECPRLLTSLTNRAILGPLTLRHNDALLATHSAMAEFTQLSLRVRFSSAAALILLRYKPEKLAPLIRPLMDILKRCSNFLLQNLAAASLAELICSIVDNKECTGTIEKILKNLCSYVCTDTDRIPDLQFPFGQFNSAASSDDTSRTDAYYGILSLLPSTRQQEKKSICSKLPRPLILAESSQSTNGCTPLDVDALDITRLGGEAGLIAVCAKFGRDLPAKLPCFFHNRFIKTLHSLENSTLPESEIVQNFFILSRIVGSLHPDILQMLAENISKLTATIKHQKTAIRYVTSQLLANWAAIPHCRKTVMEFICQSVLPLLSDMEAVRYRQGAVEVVWEMIDKLGVKITDYIVKLTVPVMRRMTDQDDSVRLMASQAFGILVRLLPLGMAASYRTDDNEEEMTFLEQLLDSKKMQEFHVAVPIQVQLRSYQQEGVNWLHFLSRYHLHGILCDDMGLGKTLQAVCILASEYCTRNTQDSKWPSLVICPSTLIGHWTREVAKFVKAEYLNALPYEGPPAERSKYETVIFCRLLPKPMATLRIRLRKLIPGCSLVISSYDIVKNDIEFLRIQQWNFCVLDEGHVIRNSKTRVFKAIKEIKCSHRLILSGTPVQNNAQDLWALFDFLMPGLLGSEKRFASRFGRPIEASRDAKASSKEIEEGATAMENLHKQVLPFILRRLKEDVLDDLPPKIIQDYYCDLSPLQLRLYEDFAKSKAQKDTIETLMSSSNSSGRSNAFQAFQYLRRVCNHPALVLTSHHPHYVSMMRELDNVKSSVFDLQHAAKFTALKQLLMDCGIGVEDDGRQSVVSSHRALIFCQLISVLQMVEEHLFRSHMPLVSYLKLDGTVPVRDRQNIVERFNNDPSIDVLLLTTSVGGLGLNLPGADTVVFVEHDWNPAKDMQAMDRAHRIGQKKVVNVYRLITRGTVEEKIMGLQKFKLHVANSIITQDNSSLQSMATEQIVDLFSVEPTSSTAKRKPVPWQLGVPHGMPVKGLKAALDNLESLWESSSQYDSEYDVDRFVESLNFVG